MNNIISIIILLFSINPSFTNFNITPKIKLPKNISWSTIVQGNNNYKIAGYDNNEIYLYNMLNNEYRSIYKYEKQNSQYFISSWKKGFIIGPIKEGKEYNYISFNIDGKISNKIKCTSEQCSRILYVQASYKEGDIYYVTECSEKDTRFYKVIKNNDKQYDKSIVYNYNNQSSPRRRWPLLSVNNNIIYGVDDNYEIFVSDINYTRLFSFKHPTELNSPLSEEEKQNVNQMLINPTGPTYPKLILKVQETNNDIVVFRISRKSKGIIYADYFDKKGKYIKSIPLYHDENERIIDINIIDSKIIYLVANKSDKYLYIKTKQ